MNGPDLSWLQWLAPEGDAGRVVVSLTALLTLAILGVSGGLILRSARRGVTTPKDVDLFKEMQALAAEQVRDSAEQVRLVREEMASLKRRVTSVERRQQKTSSRLTIALRHIDDLYADWRRRHPDEQTLAMPSGLTEIDDFDE